ncbi:MAG: energy transducer TonB, partial [Candidatus Acidiferrum sp.]
EDLNLKKYFSYSVFFHIALTAALLAGVWFQRTGESWGGVGGGDTGVKVNLVSSAAAGIPMPPNITPTESEAVDITKGLYKEEPPKPPEPKTDATKIPKFDKEKPLPPSKPSKVFEKKPPPPPNAVPYGKGGQMNIPSGYSDTPGPLNGGLAVQGQGGGDFAARYAWYVEAVRRAISQNWMQNTIDSSVRASRRAKTTMTFTITRDGTIKDIRIAESSGNRSMDDSAIRALESIERLPTLPADYSGRYVDVTFDFDLSMTR